jgi:protein-tyrosine phosphatase
VLLQVTASALLRAPRRSASASLAHALVRSGLATVVASDAHSPGPWRPPELGRAVVAAARIADPSRAEWLVQDAPEAILAGAPLPPLPSAAPTPRGRTWLRRRAGV